MSNGGITIVKPLKFLMFLDAFHFYLSVLNLSFIVQKPIAVNSPSKTTSRCDSSKKYGNDEVKMTISQF